MYINKCELLTQRPGYLRLKKVEDKKVKRGKKRKLQCLIITLVLFFPPESS